MRRKWVIALAAALILAVGAYGPMRDLLYGVRLVRMLQALASGDLAEDQPVASIRVDRTLREKPLSAIAYYPSGRAASTAVLLIPGISELGCRHPRLVALSRALASRGLLVVTPDLEMYREFRIAPAGEALEQVNFWWRAVPQLEFAGSVERAGLAGISFSATMALMAAGSPELADQVSFVVGIGGYDDPLRCSRGWFAAGPAMVAEGEYANRFYGRWVAMLAAVGMIREDAERIFVETVLRSLLLQKQLPTPPAGLSPLAQRWLNLATGAEDHSDPGLAVAIEQRLVDTVYPELSPKASASRVRCPVFLIHGTYDDLIPPEESRHLQKRLVSAESHLLISPFLTHTHPRTEPLTFATKAGAAWDLIAYFYRFAKVVN